MNKVLIVEDDKVIGQVYRHRLTKDGFTVDLATNGQMGVDKAFQNSPDIVLLDYMMPERDGLDVLKTLRATPQFQTLPIIILSNANPEVLQQFTAAGATRVLVKSNISPAAVVELVRKHLAAATPAAEPSAEEEFQAQLQRDCLAQGPEAVQEMRQHLQAWTRNPQDPVAFPELLRRVHSTAGNAGLAGLPTIARIAGALEAVLKELKEKPGRLNPSVPRTIAQAIDLLDQLFQHNPPPAITAPRILALDDEEIALRAVNFALEKAGLKPTCVRDPVVALEMLAQQPVDLIVSDIEMPGLTGLEFCAKLRTLPGCQKTPVVFVTNLTDFESRAQAVLNGGNDLVAKPFLFSELALKALIFLLKPA